MSTFPVMAYGHPESKAQAHTHHFLVFKKYHRTELRAFYSMLCRPYCCFLSWFSGGTLLYLLRHQKVLRFKSSPVMELVVCHSNSGGDQTDLTKTMKTSGRGFQIVHLASPNLVCHMQFGIFKAPKEFVL